MCLRTFIVFPAKYRVGLIRECHPKWMYCWLWHYWDCIRILNSKFGCSNAKFDFGRVGFFFFYFCLFLFSLVFSVTEFENWLLLSYFYKLIYFLSILYISCIDLLHIINFIMVNCYARCLLFSNESSITVTSWPKPAKTESSQS